MNGGMMATFEEVVDKATQDRVFYANLLVNPRQALDTAGLDLDDPIEVTRLELLLRAGQENLRASGRLVGIDVQLRADDWGIGAGCCNGALLLPGADIGPRR